MSHAGEYSPTYLDKRQGPPNRKGLNGINGGAHGEGQPQAGPSCVTPVTHTSMGRVQAEPAAPAPLTTTTSSCKGKEQQTSPTPTHTIIPYKDIHMDDSVQGPDAFDLAQGNLFPEFMGQEPLQNIIILGDACNAKNVHTLFARMSKYMYMYQGEAINHTLTNYNSRHLLPTPTRQPPNIAIRFDAGIKGTSPPPSRGTFT